MLLSLECKINVRDVLGTGTRVRSRLKLGLAGH